MPLCIWNAFIADWTVFKFIYKHFPSRFWGLFVLPAEIIGYKGFFTDKLRFARFSYVFADKY